MLCNDILVLSQTKADTQMQRQIKKIFKQPVSLLQNTTQGNLIIFCVPSSSSIHGDVF